MPDLTLIAAGFQVQVRAAHRTRLSLGPLIIRSREDAITGPVQPPGPSLAFRGWFQSALKTACAITNQHGWHKALRVLW